MGWRKNNTTAAYHSGDGDKKIYYFHFFLNLLNTFQSYSHDFYEYLSDLSQYHPPIVEGCRLTDILMHADLDDYEHLKNSEVLACFARSLKSSGKISP